MPGTRAWPFARGRDVAAEVVEQSEHLVDTAGGQARTLSSVARDHLVNLVAETGALPGIETQTAASGVRLRHGVRGAAAVAADLVRPLADVHDQEAPWAHELVPLPWQHGDVVRRRVLRLEHHGGSGVVTVDVVAALGGDVRTPDQQAGQGCDLVGAGFLDVPGPTCAAHHTGIGGDPHRMSAPVG